MTTPHNLVKNTRWGNTDHKTSPLHQHTKQLKPTKAYLFYLLPKFILMDIDIWVSGLKHRDKLKAVAKNMNYLSNPTLFAIPHDLWATYHNFNAYIWYNEIFYEWEYRCIPSPYSDSCLHYQLLERLSTGITNLNPVLIHSHKLAVTFQKINRDGN